MWDYQLLVFGQNIVQAWFMNLAIAIELCKRFEGFRSKPYLCPAGIPTIGYGSTIYRSGQKVTLNDAPITEEQAEEMMLFELQTKCAPSVMRLCPGLVGHEARFNAIVEIGRAHV